MSLRELAPYSSQGDSSSSSSARAFSATGSGSTGPTSGDPGESGGGGGRHPPGKGDDGSSRRRRGAGSVSPKACDACRHARQKCDGIEPKPCTKCTQRKIRCEYTPHTKQSKNTLIQQIHQLQARNDKMAGEGVKYREDRQRDLRQNDVWNRVIMDTVAQHGHDQEIMERLNQGQSFETIANGLLAENPDLHNPLSEVVKRFEELSKDYDGSRREENLYSSAKQWTNVSSDHKLIGHLIELYLTWVHPIHMLFSESHFVLGFREVAEGKESEHCSAALVNAICAMACHLFDEGTTSQDPPTGDVTSRVNVTRLRQGFMDEAKQRLQEASYDDTASIQALAVMYLVDWSSGRARNALGYLQSASEALRPWYDRRSSEAAEITFWGIRTLVTVCIGATYQKLHTPPVTKADGVFNNVDLKRDGEVWKFYREPGDEKVIPPSPSHATMTACYQSRLFRLVSRINSLYCGTMGRVKWPTVAEMMDRMVAWKRGLPDELQLGSDGINALPHILYLHVQYHAANVQLLNPLAQSGLFGGAQLREICSDIVQHARQGLEIVQRSCEMHTARFHMPVLSICCILLADAIMVYDPQHGVHALRIAMGALQEARIGFPLCDPLQELFRRQAVRHNVKVPSEMANTMSSEVRFSMDDILDACARLSYEQPLSQITCHFDRAMASQRADFEEMGQSPTSMSSTGKMQIGAVLNDGDEALHRRPPLYEDPESDVGA